jgi:hypothetical protein
MDPSLPKPTVELVRAEEAIFDRENVVTERALAELIERFPQNTELAHILLKVVALNKLYATNILNVYSVAERIAELKIDADLKASSIPLVDVMAPVTIGNKQRVNLSFASKYCSWHRPDTYPIYDSRAEACLWAYSKQFSLGFARKDLWKYVTYYTAVRQFRDRFELGTLTFKQIDKFLYGKGGNLV